MGRRSKKSNDVGTPENEKLDNVGAKRKPRNEMDRSTKKPKLAAVATNRGVNSMTASIPEKKLPTATSLDENSTSISKKEDDIDNNNNVGTSGQVHVDEDDINDYSEAGKAGQVHVDEPTRDCTAPEESGKTDDGPHKISKKRSKKNSKKLSKKKLKKEDDIDNGVNVGESNQVHVDEGTEANQSANKEDEASVDKNQSSKTLFVANLSSPISKDQIMEFFKDAGKIVDVRFTKQFRGFCYVEFVDEATAQKALKKNGEKLMGRDIVLSNEKGHKSSCNRGKLSIFVKGLDRSQPLEEIQKSLKEYFGSCGEITYVLTPVKRSGVSKGFAFLGFKDEDALSKALELNNTKLGDCILTVEEGGKRDGSSDGGCLDDGKHDGFGGSDDFDSGRPDDIGGGGALDSSSDFGSGGNGGFGGCPGCDSIFCHGGSFGCGNGFNSGNGFRGESGFSGGKSGEFVGGREARRGGVSHSGGGQGRGGGQSHSGGDQGRGGGRSHSGGQAQDGGQDRRGGRAPNGSRGRRGGSRGRY